jgi:hypothetical protein
MMIWFLLLPTAWMVVSGLLGVLIGQCIREDHSKQAGGTTAGGAGARMATSAVPSGDAVGVASATASDAHPAGTGGREESPTQRHDTTYAGAR